MQVLRWDELLHHYVDETGRLAAWINLYNALVIARLLQRYPIDSIQPKVFGVPNWIGFLWFFWGQHRVGDLLMASHKCEKSDRLVKI